MDQQLPQRALGRTGEQVSPIGLGGFHLGEMDDAGSVRLIRKAVDSGITFLDNSWDYNDGVSEDRMGRALQREYRDRAFLMTKIDGGTRESAAAQLFEKPVLPVLVSRGIGVLGMKPIGAGKILESGVVSAVESLHYALTLPTSVVITGCDSMKILDQALSVARTFRPLTTDQIAVLLARTAAPGQARKFESYKTTNEHDSTADHPEWMG